MKKRILQSVLLTALSTVSVAGYAAGDAKLISKDDAIQAAIDEVGGEFLGIRFDEPDTQWDVFIKSGNQAFEVEVDAKSGEIITAEKETLEEVQSELSGDLSHEGVSGDTDK